MKTQHILIVRPECTVSAELSDKDLAQGAWYEITQGILCVVGVLTIEKRSDSFVCPLAYTKWETPLRLTTTAPNDRGGRYLSQYGSLFLLADATPPDHVMPQTIRLVFTACPHMQDYMELALHLALKQMVPHLGTCGLLDLSGEMPAGEVAAVKAVETEKLGMIAVEFDCLSGYIGRCFDNDKYGLWTYSLGFTVRPGLVTYDGCGGWDNWLQLLVFLKFGQLHRLSKDLTSSLLGPKPQS
ncbi:MAG: hypothetical protein AAB880_01820 [Patescibacteria group bacterium]